MDRLKQEIIALGGTEDDYDLIMGVESTSELEGIDTSIVKKSDHPTKDKKLRKEISQIVKDIDVPEDESSDVGIEGEDEAPRSDSGLSPANLALETRSSEAQRGMVCRMRRSIMHRANTPHYCSILQRRPNGTMYRCHTFHP